MASERFAIETRKYNWPTPYEDILEENDPILGLYLEREPPVGEIRPLGLGSKFSHKKIGRIVFSPAHTPLEVRGSGGEARVIALRLDGDLFSRLYKSGGMDDYGLAACNDVHGTSIDLAMIRLSNEMTSPSLGSDLMLEAAGTMITVELSRFFQKTKLENAPPRHIITSAQLTRIIDIVESGAATSLEAIASECGFSVRTLMRNFKATTGRTIGHFVKDLRVNRAKTLLKDRSLSIKEIAFKSGFSQPSGFCTAFRNTTGITPGKYRRDIFS